MYTVYGCKNIQNAAYNDSTETLPSNATLKWCRTCAAAGHVTVADDSNVASIVGRMTSELGSELSDGMTLTLPRRSYALLASVVVSHGVETAAQSGNTRSDEAGRLNAHVPAAWQRDCDQLAELPAAAHEYSLSASLGVIVTLWRFSYDDDVSRLWRANNGFSVLLWLDRNFDVARPSALRLNNTVKH